MRLVTADDLPTINGWYKGQGMHAVEEHLFPEVGYIVDGVAAGFLYQTDSSLCFIEGFITSPTASKFQRGEAINKITNALLLTAKNHGFRQILAYTENQTMRKWCKHFQFNHKGEYSLYAREV